LKFKPNKEETMVNDIVHHPEKPSIFANCYNNGSIAVWGLLKNERLHTFSLVHEKYTYKIRFQSSNIIVSCGADCSVVRTDL
jgi:WD40 repeat protein